MEATLRLSASQMFARAHRMSPALGLGRSAGQLTTPGRNILFSRPALLTATTSCVVSCNLYLTHPVNCSNLVPLMVKNTPQAPKKALVVEGRCQRFAALFIRCAELAIHLGPVIACWLLSRVPLLGACFSREQLLALLVQALARCGPVGIKWGQWASTRFDVFDDDFCDSLGTLTNSAPAHSFEWSRECVETSFGRKLDAIRLQVSHK